MREGTAQERFERLLSRIRQPARLIGSEPGAGPGFSGRPDELRVVLGFPDAYEIGISNQALQILYHQASGIDGVGVERTYVPWVDAIAEMRGEGVPLLTTETWSPVVEAHLLGLTLQHEFNYTNVLELLDLAGIPVRAEERGEDHPIVLGGGPTTANLLPMSRFLDAVAVGDGEELFPEVLAALVEAGRDGATRRERLTRLGRIEGVFVPGISDGVTRRTLSRLEGAPYPDSPFVPLTTGVHDRAWIEVMRGCTRGCRFCQAGMWYRPVRERSPEAIAAMADVQLAGSGHQELAFASLSTTDYTCLEELLARTVREHPEVRVSLPSLRVDSAAVRLAHLASPSGPSLTLAPEAGSQRMRDIVNKNVSEADIMSAAEEAFRSGRTTLKLYFMIGLPLETDEDVAAIADLCLRIRDLGRRVLGPRASRLQLNVSVNDFVPKPFTPFQWAAMVDRETLARRQEILRARLRRPGIRLAMQEPSKSYLEAALARGGEGLGEAIEGAWRRGARFDSWTEEFRPGAWREALAAIGLDAERSATTELSTEERLPWEIVRGVPERAFLLEEWGRALRAESTPDCRWGGCSACGVCEDGPANDLAVVDTDTTPASVASAAGPPVAGGGDAVSAVLEPRHRYMLTFSVTGRQRFVGHLDRVEILRRAIRRAGGRLALSAGMRPKPLLSLALPLAVGVSGEQEMCEFELADPPPPGFLGRIGNALPPGMEPLSLGPRQGTKSLPARVTGAAYAVVVRGEEPGMSDILEATLESDTLEATLEEGARRFAGEPHVVVEEEREGKVRRVDVRAYVQRIGVTAGDSSDVCTLTFAAAVTPQGTARPERVVDALSGLIGTKLEIEAMTRTRIELG